MASNGGPILLNQFATAVLRGLGITPTTGNMRAMIGWAQAEGGHLHNDARWNFLNTTEPMPGAGNTGTQGNIKVYKNFQQGVNATVKTLQNGSYGGILHALANGSPTDVAHAIDSSPWGTHGSLIYNTIAGARAGSVPSGGSIPAPSVPGSSGTRTRTIPGTDNSGVRRDLISQFVLQGGPSNDNALIGLATGLQGAQDTPSKTVKVKTAAAPGAASQPATSSSAPTATGVVTFDGKPVAAWIAPILKYARSKGWQGTVASGYRTDAQQTAIYKSGVRPAAVPKSLGGSGSNHESSVYPGGAVDVTNASQLSQILQGSPYAQRLIWAGAKDPVHFSHPHGGGY